LSKVASPVEDKVENETSATASVTMIVAAYNEERVIEDKLRNISELDYPDEKLSVIIASDGSNDCTNEIVKRYESRKVRLIEYPRMGKVNVLNRAG